MVCSYFSVRPTHTYTRTITSESCSLFIVQVALRFCKGVFKIVKVIREIPNGFGTQYRKALRNLAVSAEKVTISPTEAITFSTRNTNIYKIYKLCTTIYSE